VSRVARRFGRAAATYADATPIQHRVAAALADRIMEAGAAPGARVAEFGCGTGHLPSALWPRLSPGLWIATDLAPAMARAAARALPHGAVAAVMDAARPALAPGFDLVCSSLTLQWLDDPAAAVAGWRALVRPGGHLAVATLAQGTFAEWRAALAEAGVRDPGPAFPSLQTLKGWFGPGARIEPLTLLDRHAGALAFARAARAAGIDAGAGRALGAAAMRRALRAFDARGAATTYAGVLIVERVEG
jgi:malonyl-CoA O-methyltransferase